MINYHKEIVAALNKILPTYYELVVNSGTKTPCITYIEGNNYDVTGATGETLGYSRINYIIKVWGNDLAELQKYALEIDKALRSLGFKRTSSGELKDMHSTMIQKILNYECLALEEYKEA